MSSSHLDVDALATELAAVIRRHLGPPSKDGLRAMTIKEVCKRTGRSHSWVYMRMDDGSLPFVQLGRNRHGVRPEDLEAFFSARPAG